MTPRPSITRREFLQASVGIPLTARLGFPAYSRRTSVIRILWTGDTHGHLLPAYHREPYGESFLRAHRIGRGTVRAYLSASPDFPELAKQYGQVGGFAHLATLIEKERSALPEHTLLLDSGDAWYGSAIALLTEGKAVVEVMNAMRYDAMTLHWEFNLGKEVLLSRIREAQFAVLAQNLVDTDFEDRVLQPSIVKNLGGIRVGVVGQAYPFSLLTTERRDANPGWRMGYREDELRKEVGRLRSEEGAHIVVLLSHMGLDQDRVFASRIPGLDVIVGGHTHDVLWEPVRVGNTLIVHAGSHGKLLGKLDLEVSAGRITDFRYELIPVLSQRIEPDSRIARLILALYRPYEQVLHRVIGETRSLLYRRALFGGTTDVFLSHAYRELAAAELSCVPGWRFGTTLLPGPVTVEDVYNAMKPTPSPLYKVRLTGRQIRRALEDNLDNVFNPDPLLRLGGDVVRCAGLKVLFRKTHPLGQRIVSMTAAGRPLQADRKYSLATSGGRIQYLDPKPEASPRPAVQDLLDYIQRTSPIRVAPAETFVEIR